MSTTIGIVDRKKDIIISGGENISSLEIESVFYDHPSIKEVAVVAAAHEKWGETPVAMVVMRKGFDSITEENLIEYARSRMAHFKVPSKIKFVDYLPKNSNGKVLKHHLRRDLNKTLIT